jgi:hypothetical protein
MTPRDDRDPAWRLPAILRPWDVFDVLSVTDPLPFAAGLWHVLARSLEELNGQWHPRSRPPS